MSTNESNNYKEQNYWRSLREKEQGLPEEIKKNEFNEGVTDEFDIKGLNKVSRRKFLAIVAASSAFAATSCTNYHDRGEIIPYNKRPDDLILGEADYYATSLNDRYGNGILVKVREGRPVKIDGNPEHPINKGKVSSAVQASILNLYDPERLKYPSKNRRKTSWAEVDSDIIKILNSSKGKIGVITNGIFSPTEKYLFDEFLKKYNAKHFNYNPVELNNFQKAYYKAYGNYNYPTLNLEKAKIILSIGADFIGREGNVVENLQKYSKIRDVNNPDKFARLYAAEADLSLTGANADYRLRLRNDYYLDFILLLIKELADEKIKSKLDNVLSGLSKESFIKSSGISKNKFELLLDDLRKHKSKVALLVGKNQDEQVHSAALLLNEILGNDELFDYKSVNITSEFDNRDELIEAISSKQLDVVINYNCNPVYDLSYMGFENHLKNCKYKIAISEVRNETVAACNYVLPANHPLESWGDNYVRSDVYTLQQPIIAPLYDTRQNEETLMVFNSGDREFLKKNKVVDLIKSNFKKNVYNKLKPLTDFNSFWNASLHDGFVKIDTNESKPEFNFDAIKDLSVSKKKFNNLLEISKPYFLEDGKYANNGWLLEIPHPISKVTWDNYLAISPTKAKEMDVDMGDMVEVKSGEYKIELPVLVQPGLADDYYSVEYGFGRSNSGKVASDVGFNVNEIRKTKNKINDFLIYNVEIKKLGKYYKLASTQEHHSLDDSRLKDIHKSRGIIQEGTIEEYLSNPHFLHEEKHEVFSITDDVEYKGNKWAMVIDQNKCIGCSHCVTSCNVENNVPVVGKDQVLVGREMHWMRIDRYYSGTSEDPEVSTQPMLCQHCDNAPCENVCPVNATNHSPDGLNQMVYNRCVGTRYCSNNCPYKVRRFNFFNFRDHFEEGYYDNEATSLVHNPEVTVRSRGVMEKCTFCVQRIMDARAKAIAEGREVEGNEVVTACQQACPTNAITFGNANDKDSDVAKLREHNLGYHVLEETNVRPNVTYIAKLRNTHAEERKS